MALFVSYESHDHCSIMLDGSNWSVETRNVRHGIQETAC